jgi:hypothetical protein
MSAERMKQPAAARKESFDSPFPVSPTGKAGAGGFPPRRQKRAAPPHKRGKALGFAPLVRSPGEDARSYLTMTGLLMEARCVSHT